MREHERSLSSAGRHPLGSRDRQRLVDLANRFPSWN
jgi:hypothetical protein